MRRLGISLAVLASAACSEDAMDGALILGPPVSSHGLGACVGGGVDGEAHDGFECATYRAIGGVSMGGGAGMRIALENPELFDVAGSLGSPYIDLRYFLLSVGEISNGGFCPREQLLANLANIDVKDDPATWCGPVQFEALALPNTSCDGFAGDFNHHYRGPAAGRGGSFNREGSFEIVQDFALAYGNPASYNPASPYLPSGVSLDHHVALPLDAMRTERDEARRRICADGVDAGLVDAAYNPDGAYPVITFCDGNGPVNGEYEPGTSRFPVEVALAVDFDRDGQRDYGEPVLAHSFEPYRDVGADGAASVDEAGYDRLRSPDPAGDDYHWLDNPLGTEGNDFWDAGEPFDDHGIDGVAGSDDFGEGNGTHDLNPNVARAFSRSPRERVATIPDADLDRLHIWVDAGIRDFLLSAQITNQFWGALKARRPDAALIDDWAGLAQLTLGDDEYDPYLADLSEAKVGRQAYLRYGDPSVCPGTDEVEGRGNHVGPAWEILFRLQTMFAFASARFPNGDFRGLTGPLLDQGGPTGDLADFVQVRDYHSAALGRAQPYVVILPPDYYRDPAARYPVIYFLHGQGQKATDLAASALLFLGPQMESQDSQRTRARRSDWQKMIIVFADGECVPGECHTGTFYVDFQGLDGDGAKHGEAFFELMREVDGSFRIKAPEMLPIAE